MPVLCPAAAPVILPRVKRTRQLKLVLASLVIGAAIWLFASGAYRDVDATELRERLRAAGAWGGVAFVLLFAFVQPLGPSGHFLIIGASLVWSAPAAFTLSWIGAIWGQFNAFVFYRYLAHDWAQSRLSTRLLRYERAFVERPFRTVLLFRLMTFTWTLGPAVLGVSRVRVGPMLAATLVGLAPGIAVDVWLGASVFEWAASQF